MNHQIDSKNEWLLPPASLTAKFELAFVLTLENIFSWRFYFKANRKSISSSKSSTRYFQNSPPFDRSVCFYVTICENFECFQYFNFETDFLENEILFQKTGVTFLVESTKIENASFPYKTAIPEVNVKTNRMMITI